MPPPIHFRCRNESDQFIFDSMFSLFSTLLNAFVQLNNKCYKVIQLIKGSHMIEIKFCFHNSWILWVCSKYSNFLCDKQKIWVFISVLKWINLANRDRQYSPRCSLLLVSVLSVFRLAAYSHSARRSVFPTSVVRIAKPKDDDKQKLFYSLFR